MKLPLLWTHAPGLTPPGMMICNTCGKVRGESFRRYTQSPGEPQGRVISRCLCEGVLCSYCLTHAIHRPGTQEYQCADGRMWHQPGFVMQGRCSQCRYYEDALMPYFALTRRALSLSAPDMRRVALRVARLCSPAPRFEEELTRLAEALSSDREVWALHQVIKDMRIRAISAAIRAARAPSSRHHHTLAVRAVAGARVRSAAQAAIYHTMSWARLKQRELGEESRLFQLTWMAIEHILDEAGS